MDGVVSGQPEGTREETPHIRVARPKVTSTTTSTFLEERSQLLVHVLLGEAQRLFEHDGGLVREDSMLVIFVEHENWPSRPKLNSGGVEHELADLCLDYVGTVAVAVPRVQLESQLQYVYDGRVVLVGRD